MAGLVTATFVATPIAAGAALPSEAPDDGPFTIAEDSGLATYNVLANDPDGSVIIDKGSASKGTVGTVTLGNDPTIVQLAYTPDADRFGDDSFVYTIWDGTGDAPDETNTSTATVSISITAVADAPVAGNDALPLIDEETGEPIDVITEGDVAVDITAVLLANDGDIDNIDAPGTETLVIIGVSDPEASAGTVEFTPATDVAPAKVTYEPTSDSAETDSFTYTVWDGTGEAPAEGTTSTATVNITIVPVEDDPVAVADGVDRVITVAEGGSTSIDVLANDTDVDGGTKEVTAITVGPSNGTAEINAETGEIDYIHDSSDTTSDEFTYEINGGTTATVTIAVTPEDDAPVAVNDGEDPVLTIVESKTLTIDVLANDQNPDLGELSIDPDAFADVPEGHSAAVVDGKVLYTHTGDDLAAITFTYGVNGGSTATVSLSVDNFDDDGPVVANIDLDIVEDDEATTVADLTDEKDADGDALSISAIGTDGINEDGEGNNLGVDALKGTVTLDEAGLVLTYTPNADANGTDTFTVEVSDGTTGDELTVTVTVSIEEVNDAPVAQGDVYNTPNWQTVNDAAFYAEFVPEWYDLLFGGYPNVSVLVLEDTPTVLPVLLNDGDVDGDAISVDLDSVVIDPNIGSAVAHADGLTFTPAADYSGSFSFTYRATDGEAFSETVTVSVLVAAQHDPTVAKADAVSVAEDNVVYVNVLFNDSDADDLGLHIESFEQPEGGYVAIAGTRLRVEPDPDFNGDLVFTYTVQADADIDNYSASAQQCSGFWFDFCEPVSATVTVSVGQVNDRPDAKTDSGISVDEDADPFTIDVLFNDTDIDGDDLSIWSVGPAALGTTKIVDNEIEYTPNANAYGSDSFVYYAYDGQALSVASVSIEINPVNDAPTIDDESVQGNEDEAVVVELNAGDPDPDNEVLAIIVSNVSVPGSDATDTVSLVDSTLTFTPPANWFGVAEITVVVTDDDDLQTEGLITIQINSVNDVPTIGSTEDGTDEDEAVRIPISFADIEDTDESISISQAPVMGTAVVDGSDVIYTPNADVNGEDTFKVSITDSDGATAVADVYVDIYPVNDAPTIQDMPGLVGPEDTPLTFELTVGDIDSENVYLEYLDFIPGEDDEFFFRPRLLLDEPFFIGDPFFGDFYEEGPWVDFDGTTATFYPPENWFGTATLVILAHDGEDETIAFIDVEITPINDEPWMFNASANVDEDGSFLLSVNFGDVEDYLRLEVLEAPEFGTVELVPEDDTKVLYTPFANVFGEDTFKLITTDSEGASATGTMVFTINSINDVPTIDGASAEVLEDDSVIIPITFDDVEDDLTLVVSEDPSNGSVEVDGSNVIYTPNADFNGDDTFKVSVTDTDDASAEATVNVDVIAVNDAPSIDPKSAEVDEDGSVLIELTAADIDSKISVSITSNPSKGTATLDGWTVTYTPNANANGADSFEVQAIDGDGALDVATVSVSIAAINDVPTAAECSAVIVETGKSVTVDVSACGDDIDGDKLTVVSASAAATNGTVTPAGDQGVSYTSDADFEGSDEIALTLTDGNGGQVGITVGVTVTAPVNPYVGATATDGEVVRIYSAMLGRLPDEGGFDYWTSLRAAGLSLDEMIVLFAGSAEFKTTFGDRIVEDTNEEWVDFVYGEIMDRTADAAGRAYWIEILESGALGRSSMVVLFAQSPEYMALTQTS